MFSPSTLPVWSIEICSKNRFRSPFSLMKIYEHFLKDFELEINKKNVAKHEISKWRPISRWMPERFYGLKLVYLIFFKFRII
jgi:hypothetical protein